jgi:signal transduction histidine kinase
MSKQAAEHHTTAAEHHDNAARHHREAAKHHEAGNYETAAHHAHTSQGHLHHATHHAAEAAKSHVEHHGAKSKAVVLRFDGDQVGLRVHDFGVGIPSEKLQEFDGTGANKGLGLTGMKHRVQDQLGKFHLSSNASGTTIRVELPAN